MSSLREWASSVDLENEVFGILQALASACEKVSGVLRTAHLGGIRGLAGSTNVQNESQKPLDIISNDIFLDACKPLKQLALAVSEEEQGVIAISPTGRFAAVFDPLDGSSNLDVNVTVGSIFSVVTATTEEDLLPGGQPQHLAGFASYGPSTDLIVAAKMKIARFSLDEAGSWNLVERDFQLPDRYLEVAINPARVKSWDPVIQRFITDAFEGERPRYNARWVGSLVAEAQRILTRGGLFMYPADISGVGGKARLRLLYEARPIAAIVEAAGGRCSTGRERVLDVTATGIHQRVPLLFGGASQIEEIQSSYQVSDR